MKIYIIHYTKFHKKRKQRCVLFTDYLQARSTRSSRCLSFKDSEIALVCNDEGKLIEVPYNRATRDEEGGRQAPNVPIYFRKKRSELDIFRCSTRFDLAEMERFRLAASRRRTSQIESPCSLRSRCSLFAHSLDCASSATGGACLAPSRGRSRSNLFPFANKKALP